MGLSVMPVHPAADLVLSKTFYFYLLFPVVETATVNWLKTLKLAQFLLQCNETLLGDTLHQPVYHVQVITPAGS